MLVRPATRADAPALARVHVASWRSAYVGIMPDAYLAGLDEARFESGWVRALEEGVSTVLVGEMGGTVQGFATFGAARDKAPSATAELYALNLHPEAFGSGLAASLIARVTGDLSTVGHCGAYLWVAEHNPRARRFYEREGWGRDGGVKTEEFGGEPLTELRYQRSLP